jgi:hypothetical protein
VPPPSAGSETRRQRLVRDLQGRTLEQAYLRSDIRSDLEAEADDSDPARFITRDQLNYLGELVDDQIQAARFPEGASVKFAHWRPERQAVIVPGFLGSELSDVDPRGDGLIWISPSLAFSDRLSSLQLARYDNGDRDLRPRVRIEATGPLPALYDLLRLRLRSNGYSVSVHPVDWRTDLDAAADPLVTRLRQLAGARQPIHVIGLLRLLLRGARLGWAMEQFNARYAELGTRLATIVQQVKYDGPMPDKDKLAYLWTARNDARSLIVLGDPAVRLAAAPAEGGAA